MQNLSQLFSLTRDMNLLFVEDHLPILESTKEILEHYFKHIDTATNGLEGLEQYRTFLSRHGHPYDLVITDIQMPRMDGVEMVREIKRIEERQQIIVLSAYQESHYLLDLINLGIAQFVLKPISQEPLLNALYKVASRPYAKYVSQDRSTILLGKGYRYEIKRRQLYQDDIPVKLTRHELLLMHLLAEKFEKVCTIDDIVNYFYAQGIDLFSDNIRTLVSRLRRKLPPGSIESLYAIGYKLTTTD